MSNSEEPANNCTLVYKDMVVITRTAPTVGLEKKKGKLKVTTVNVKFEDDVVRTTTHVAFHD